MLPTEHRDCPEVTTLASMDASVVMAALRQGGAQQFDPVGFYYLETLAQRTHGRQGRVKQLLECKLVQALGVFQARFVQAQSEARRAIDEHIAGHAAPLVADVQRLLEAGDFQAVRQHLAAFKKSQPKASLAELSSYLAQHGALQEQVGLGQGAGSRGELKTTRYFRNTWSKLSVDKRVTQALEQAPQNAGPMNSHRLVLRSLALMREISPDYLNRFTSYVDTLLCLEQGGQGKPAPARKPARAKVGKK